MAAQDTTTLLKELPWVGQGGVLGSPVAHRRGRQRGQAKSAAVPAGLLGNRYAVLAETLEDDKLAGDATPQQNSGMAEMSSQAEEAPAAPQGATPQADSGAGDTEGVQAQLVPALNRRARRAAAAAAAEHSAGAAAARFARRGLELELVVRHFVDDVEAARETGSPYAAAWAALSMAAAILEDAEANRAFRELVAVAELGFAGAGAARAVVQLAEAEALAAAADSNGLGLLAEVS